MTTVTARRLGSTVLALTATMLVTASCARSPYTYVEEPEHGLYFRVPERWQVTERELPVIVPSDGYGAQDFTRVGGVLDLWEAQLAAPGAGNVPEAKAYISFLNPQIRHVLTNEAVRSYRHDLLDFTTGSGVEIKALAQTPDSGVQILDERSYSTELVYGNRLVWKETQPDGTDVVHDDLVLVDWGNQLAYELLFSCATACYEANRADILAIVDSLTVEEPR